MPGLFSSGSSGGGSVAPRPAETFEQHLQKEPIPTSFVGMAREQELARRRRLFDDRWGGSDNEGGYDGDEEGLGGDDMGDDATDNEDEDGEW